MYLKTDAERLENFVQGLLSRGQRRVVTFRDAYHEGFSADFMPGEAISYGRLGLSIEGLSRVLSECGCHIPHVTSFTRIRTAGKQSRFRKTREKSDGEDDDKSEEEGGA